MVLQILRLICNREVTDSCVHGQWHQSLYRQEAWIKSPTPSHEPGIAHAFKVGKQGIVRLRCIDYWMNAQENGWVVGLSNHGCLPSMRSDVTQQLS